MVIGCYEDSTTAIGRLFVLTVRMQSSSEGDPEERSTNFYFFLLLRIPLT